MKLLCPMENISRHHANCECRQCCTLWQTGKLLIHAPLKGPGIIVVGKH